MRAGTSRQDRRRAQCRTGNVSQGPTHLMAAAVIAIGSTLLLLSSHLPLPLVLPVVGLLLLIGATGTAWAASRRPHPIGGPSYWDVSGALAFAGIAATLLSEPEAVLPLL